ncbi:MAG: elongation factor Ts [Dehalococcoidales bacterium]|nr:elongation factor Ts [Dehalococcoidales bacterium]
MNISTAMLRELRDQTGAGIMACRNTLLETEGDLEKALHLLKERSITIIQKKADRTVSQGLIEAYIHTGGTIGSMVEVNCETDFVARTSEFKELAHNLAMQVAAMPPKFISREDIPEGPEGKDVDPEADCLLLQTSIKDPDKTIQDVINEAIAKLRENIKVNRFARFKLGS